MKRIGFHCVTVKRRLFSFLAIACLTACGARAQASATLTVRADQPGAVVSSNLFGIFFEEINYGGDGGIYAERVRNRSFANSTNPDFWTLVTNGVAAGTMGVDTSLPLNPNNLRSLQLTRSSGTGGIGAANSGYWGIALQSGAIYDLSFYARSAGGFTGPVTVQLQSADGGSVYAQASVGGLTADWQRFAASFTSSGSNNTARLVLSISNTATVWLGATGRRRRVRRARLPGRPPGGHDRRQRALPHLTA